MSAAKYLLFMFEDHEARGGIGDLVLNVSTLEACMARAESEVEHHERVAQIVEVPSLRLIKTGKWTYEPSPLTGGPITWAYQWSDVDVAAPPPMTGMHPGAARAAVMAHRNDDFFTMQVNLSAGQVRINGEPSMMWCVPLATSQPAVNRRKAPVIASLITYDVHGYAELSLEVLKRKLAEKRGWTDV
jgi:hypothetical protein